MAPLSVLLADDHPLIVEALSILLRRIEGVTVLGRAHDGRTATAMALDLRPDIVLMDVSMPGLDGIEAAALIRAIAPSVRVVMLSSRTDAEAVDRALEAGASGYVAKDATPAELASALVAARAGDTYLSASVAAHAGAAALTARQREVLGMIANGWSTKRIASALKVSVKTVETHRLEAMRRLRIGDMAGLVRFAAGHSLVDVES